MSMNLNKEGRRELDNFLLNCPAISQEEREDIMEYVNKPNYEKAYHLFMMYLGELDVATQEKISKGLEEHCGL